MTTALLVLATIFLAYANGANDNFKGVATIYGSGTASYRRALAYATIAALAGSLAALWGGDALAATFGGKGLVPDAIAKSSAFATSVASGAAATILLATFLGLPVSTTHAITGALVGAGFVAVGRDVNLAKLGGAFLLPLLASPIAALIATFALYPAFRLARRRLGVVEETCLCVGPARVPVPVPTGLVVQPGARLALTADVTATLPIAVSVGDEATCVRRYGGDVLGVSANAALDTLHFLTAGIVCFARALNDTPKLVGLVALAGVMGTRSGLVLAGAAVAVGGLLNARRVAETMSRRAVSMNAGQGFTANLVTSALVLAASFVSLPVSTTHVSCGAIFGIGAANRTARLGVIGQILLAWVTTLPLAAGLAALVFAFLR